MYCHDGWEGEVVIGVHSFRLIAQHVMLFDQPDIPILSSTDTSKRSVVISGSNSRGERVTVYTISYFCWTLYHQKCSKY